MFSYRNKKGQTFLVSLSLFHLFVFPHRIMSFISTEGIKIKLASGVFTWTLKCLRPPLRVMLGRNEFIKPPNILHSRVHILLQSQSLQYLSDKRAGIVTGGAFTDLGGSTSKIAIRGLNIIVIKGCTPFLSSEGTSSTSVGSTGLFLEGRINTVIPRAETTGKPIAKTANSSVLGPFITTLQSEGYMSEWAGWKPEVSTQQGWLQKRSSKSWLHMVQRWTSYKTVEKSSIIYPNVIWLRFSVLMTYALLTGKGSNKNKWQFIIRLWTLFKFCWTWYLWLNAQMIE